MPAAPDSLSFVAPVVAPRTPQVAPYPSVPRPRAPILRPRLPGVTPGSVVSSSGANAPYRPCPKYASAERAESSVSGTTCAPSEASSTPRFHRGRRLQRGEGRAAFAPRNRSLTPRRPVRSVSQTTQDRVPKQQRKGCLISSCTTTFSHIERHFLYDHLPWYAAPLTACWLCGEQCTQSAKLDRHWSANHEGVSQSVNWNKERLEDYLKRVDCLLQFLASKQQPRARNVHELYDRLQDSEQLKVCMAKVSIPPGVWEAFCSQHSLPVPAEGFKLNPSNSPAVLLYWRSLAALVMPLNRRDREQVRTIAAAVTTVSGASSSQTASQVTPQPEPVPMDTSESTQTDASVPEPSAQAEPTVSAPAEVSGCPPDSASTETTAFVTDSLNVRTVAEVVVEGGSGGPIRRERVILGATPIVTGLERPKPPNFDDQLRPCGFTGSAICSRHHYLTDAHFHMDLVCARVHKPEVLLSTLEGLREVPGRQALGSMPHRIPLGYAVACFLLTGQRPAGSTNYDNMTSDPRLKLTFGAHPNHLAKVTEDAMRQRMAYVMNYSVLNGVVAIGEIGL